MFGEVGLDYSKLRELKYLKDRDGNIKGYITGVKLFIFAVFRYSRKRR